jgi:hypothetical protein
MTLRILKLFCEPEVILAILELFATFLLGFGLADWIVFHLLPPFGAWLMWGLVLVLGFALCYPSAKLFQALNRAVGNSSGSSDSQPED